MLMKRIVGWWRSESAMLTAILLALVNASLIPGVTGKVLGAVLPVLGGGAVRQTVWAPDTAAQALTSVASQLTAGAAGKAGQVTPAAQAIIDGVVDGAGGQ